MTWAGVIGHPIAHSLSPVIHTAAWNELGISQDWEYRRIDVASESLAAFMAGLAGDCVGLSVTMPHKHAIVPYLDVVDPLAQAVGAVNTVIPAAGVLSGFNTDVYGIMEAFSASGVSPRISGVPRQALILGSGASAASALNALWSLGVERIAVAARRFAGPHSVLRAAHRMGVECEQIFWKDTATITSWMTGADYVVSTVPAGVADAVVVPTGLASHQQLLDIVYSPWDTALSQAWRNSGGSVVHGTEMLLYQAALQVKLMTGREPDTAQMRRALFDYIQEAS